MVIEAINDFRRENGKNPIFHWNQVENDHCIEHCLHLSFGNNEHTPRCFLCGKAEAIAVCSFNGNFRDTIRYVIFDMLAADQAHKDVLLNFNRMSFGVFTHNYQLYLTVRAWNE